MASTLSRVTRWWWSLGDVAVLAMAMVSGLREISSAEARLFVPVESDVVDFANRSLDSISKYYTRAVTEDILLAWTSCGHREEEGA